MNKFLWHVLTTLCVYMDGKVSMVFKCNCFRKTKDFSRLRTIQAVAYTMEVVMSKIWCEIDTLLLHSTNRKYHMAYLFVPFPVTLDDIEGYLCNAGPIKCNFTNICATFSTVLTDMVRSLGNSWASCCHQQSWSDIFDWCQCCFSRALLVFSTCSNVFEYSGYSVLPEVVKK